MQITRCFEIEVENKRRVESLDDALQERILDIPKNAEGPNFEEMRYIRARRFEEGEEREEFEVLCKSYLKTPTDSILKSIFSQGISVQLVISTTPSKMVEFGDFLNSAGYRVHSARELSHANFTFATNPAHNETVQNYKKKIESMVAENYMAVADLTIEQNVSWDKHLGSVCSGMIHGSVAEVLDIRKIIKDYAIGISLKEESIKVLK